MRTSGFFGENLFQNTSNLIIISVSEKNAMIAIAYLAQFTWIATGGKEEINENKYQILNKLNRPVYFFPDLSKPKDGMLSTYDYWQEKAKKYLICSYKFSDLLEKFASEAEKRHGLDLADFLLIKQA